MVPQKLLRHMPGRWAGQPRLPLALGIVPSGSHSPLGQREREAKPAPWSQSGALCFSSRPGPRGACLWGERRGHLRGGAVPRAPAGPGETEDAGVQLPSPAPSAPWVSVAGGGGRCGLCWPVVGGRRQFLLVWAPGLFPGPFS